MLHPCPLRNPSVPEDDRIPRRPPPAPLGAQDHQNGSAALTLLRQGVGSATNDRNWVIGWENRTKLPESISRRPDDAGGAASEDSAARAGGGERHGLSAGVGVWDLSDDGTAGPRGPGGRGAGEEDAR